MAGGMNYRQVGGNVQASKGNTTLPDCAQCVRALKWGLVWCDARWYGFGLGGVAGFGRWGFELGGRGWCWVVAAYVSAGCMLAKFFIAISQVIFVRTRSGFCRAGAVVRVIAGLLLRTLVRVQCELNFLSLLATVRGGTSFLCPTATKKRSKENASPQSVLSVPSVQATAFGSRVARCSLEPRCVETLLLANPYIPTLRHQCSRARSMAH